MENKKNTHNEPADNNMQPLSSFREETKKGLWMPLPTETVPSAARSERDLPFSDGIAPGRCRQHALRIR